MQGQNSRASLAGAAEFPSHRQLSPRRFILQFDIIRVMFNAEDREGAVQKHTRVENRALPDVGNTVVIVLFNNILGDTPKTEQHYV